MLQVKAKFFRVSILFILSSFFLVYAGVCMCMLFSGQARKWEDERRKNTYTKEFGFTYIYITIQTLILEIHDGQII